MYKYSICNQADEEIFNKQCDALEKNIPNIKKGNLLIDVDESKIQEYFLNNKSISVCNSNYTNEIFIKSEVELKQFFK